MEAQFWLDRWHNQEIGWHQQETNPFLVKHFDTLQLTAGDRVLVPLCGKTKDIHWLLEAGYRVVGAELSAIAIEQLFEELGLQPEKQTTGALTLYSAGNLEVFVGDFFALSADQLGSVQGVYDRAALVALSPELRRRYSTHLVALTGAAAQLVIVFEYDQNELPGPPFSIPAPEISAHYQRHYHLLLLDQAVLDEDLKGKVAATEVTWLLRPLG